MGTLRYDDSLKDPSGGMKDPNTRKINREGLYRKALGKFVKKLDFMAESKRDPEYVWGVAQGYGLKWEELSEMCQEYLSDFAPKSESKAKSKKSKHSQETKSEAKAQEVAEEAAEEVQSETPQAANSAE